MKKNLQTPNKQILLLLFSILAVFRASAQKAEDVQTTNLLVSKIKVDGKLNDWELPLKASNKSTKLAYTIANDGKNLYLAIHSLDVESNRKIMAGGITFTVNTDNKKRTKDAFTLTYPVIKPNNRRPGGGAGGVLVGGGGGGQRGSGQTITVMGGGGGGGFNRQGAGPADSKRRDSLQMVQTKTQLAAAKDIKIAGFKNITDSLISIYNEYSIKAMANADEKGLFVLEIAIPLEQLGLSVENAKEFSYNIKVNGLQLSGEMISFTAVGAGGGGNRGGDMQDMTSPTDLWGKYTLAR